MVRIAPLVLLAALCGTVLAAFPAAAHDQLIDTEPRSNEIVAAMPEAVRLTFSGSPMAIGTTVLVVDAEGERVGSAQPTVDRAVVSLELPAAPTDAWYQVRWRAVAADGHLLSGSFDFGVGDPSMAPKPELAPNSAADTSSSPALANGPDRPTASDRPVPPWGVALIGAALAVGTWWLADVLTRRRRAMPRTETPANQGVHND